MRPPFQILLVVAAMAALSAGCGTTQIIASDPFATITVDGVTVGRGQASVQKTGTPGTVQVSARTDDGRVTSLPMRRQFGWTAGLLGFVTYGVCFFACWQYPDTLYVMLPQATQSGASAWGVAPGPAQDPWLVPPPDWSNTAPPDTTRRPPATAPTVQQSAPPAPAPPPPHDPPPTD